MIMIIIVIVAVQHPDPKQAGRLTKRHLRAAEQERERDDEELQA